jgi:GNAT superfamily N-acetyltransferase
MVETSNRTVHGTIRRARPDDAGDISELAVRSKGHWGYDPEFLEACREDLALSPEEIAETAVYVFEGNDGIAGYYRLMPMQHGAADLDALFVAPEAIGQGIGRRLWEHAVDTAAELGFRELIIQSDPHAEGFYLAMGAIRDGVLESTVSPGRMLPLLRYAISPSPGQAASSGVATSSVATSGSTR